MTHKVHETLIDRDNNRYRVIKTTAYRDLIIASIIKFVILTLIVATLLDNLQSLERMAQTTHKTNLRNKAINEMLIERTKIQQQMFIDICKLKGDNVCTISEKWWADPSKYPDIAGDEDSIPLFPPKR